MKQMLLSLIAGDHGQVLIEYALLMAFVTLVSAVLFIGAGGNISGVWVATNTRISAANATS